MLCSVPTLRRASMLCSVSPSIADSVQCVAEYCRSLCSVSPSIVDRCAACRRVVIVDSVHSVDSMQCADIATGVAAVQCVAEYCRFTVRRRCYAMCRHCDWRRCCAVRRRVRRFCTELRFCAQRRCHAVRRHCDGCRCCAECRRVSSILCTTSSDFCIINC